MIVGYQCRIAMIKVYAAKTKQDYATTSRNVQGWKKVTDMRLIDADLLGMTDMEIIMCDGDYKEALKMLIDKIDHAPTIEPNESKYEYYYDHTDCIWYRPEARNRCPVTCAQYRDGWNDAMNYIFRDGKGYRPYRRDKKYETD